MKKVINKSKENTDKVAKVNLDGNDEKSTSALISMGINNPTQIIRYTLRPDGNKDVLKIYYKRVKGSFLPSSRKYKFGRSARTLITDSGKPEYENTFDISPILLEAVEELDKIVDESENLYNRKKTIILEIDRLEKTLNSRIDTLREQVEFL